MGTMKVAWILVMMMPCIRSSHYSGLVRYQRGDQGPDDDLDHSEINIETNTVVTDMVVPPVGGPNVCRSRSRTFCCPGWHQRGSTGLCLAPVCTSQRCGSNGRCIKPNLCLCEGGKIASRCGDGGAIEDGGSIFFVFAARAAQQATQPTQNM